MPQKLSVVRKVKSRFDPGFCLLPGVALFLGSFFFVFPAEAAILTVKHDGTGNYSTIQACATAARAGDTCLVNAGVYNEYVKPAAGGTSDSARITFKAQGVVTMQGFDIR